MSDLDSKLSAALEGVAAHGRDRTRPASAGDVRQIAHRRLRRRQVTAAGLTVLALVVASGVVLAGGPLGPDQLPSDRSTNSKAAELPAFGEELLITQDEVALNIPYGADIWRHGDVRPLAADRISACQTADKADPRRSAAFTRVVTSDKQHNVGSVSQLIEQSGDVAAASVGFRRAVAWFETCDLNPSLESSDVSDELQKRAEALPAISGVDELRILVRKQRPISDEGPVGGIFAGLIRVHDVVSVLVWDSYDDSYGDQPAGFVELLRIAGSRIAGVELPSVPDAALLQAQDQAVVTLLPKAASGEMQPLHAAHAIAPFCEPTTEATTPPGFRAGRRTGFDSENDIHVLGSRLIDESVIEFMSEEAARRWLVSTSPETGRCETSIPRQPATVAFAGGDESWAVSSASPISDGAVAEYHASIRVGTAVAAIRVYGSFKKSEEERAIAVFAAAEDRLLAAYR